MKHVELEVLLFVYISAENNNNKYFYKLITKRMALQKIEAFTSISVGSMRLCGTPENNCSYI